VQDEDSDSAGQQAGPGSGDVAPVNDLATRRLAARENNSNRDDASRRRNETTRTHHETARNERPHTTHDETGRGHREAIRASRLGAAERGEPLLRCDRPPPGYRRGRAVA
jgi:hypothetical protein